MSLRSLSNEWRDAVRAERGIGISRSRRVNPLIVFIAVGLLLYAINTAWPTSQETPNRPNLTPAPVAGDSFRRELAELRSEIAKLKAKNESHSGLPAVLPDRASIDWGRKK